MPNWPLWIYGLWAVEPGLFALMFVPRWLSNQHGGRADRRHRRGEYREPNRAARIYDWIVYLFIHPKSSCLCYRCVPNKWKGDWSDATNRPGGNHRGSAVAAGTPSPTAGIASASGGPAGAGTRVTGTTYDPLTGMLLSSTITCGYCGGSFAVAPGVTHTHVCVPATMPSTAAWPLSGSTAHFTGSFAGPPGGQVMPMLGAPEPPPTPWPTDLPRRRLAGVDYVIGFRAWVFNEHQLWGFNGTPWEGVPALHAGVDGMGVPISCPSPLCTRPGARHGGVCGYHAYSRAEDFYRDAMFGRVLPHPPLPASITVHGLCKMWGIIVRHGDGYRSQYAAPVALLRSPIIDPRVMEAAAKDLGVALIDPAIEVQMAVAREHGHVWGDPLPNASSGVDELPALD